MRELDRLVPELLVLERRLELLPDGRELLAEPAPADQKGHEPARGAATPTGEGAGWDGALRTRPRDSAHSMTFSGELCIDANASLY